MAESNVNIMLDTVRRNRISVIYAVENDYGARFITAAIMTDGKKKAVKKTAVVTINAERPDGQRKAFEGSVNEDGTVKVPVTQWMLEFEGEVVCSVSIVTSTSRLTTTHFYIQAQYSVWDGTSAPSADDPDKDVIVSIVAAENERVANENARISAENTRRTAETARIDAENTRIANESVRVSNEAERVSAESVRKTEFATWQGEIGKISAFDKRIENLEAAVSPGLVTPTVDDSAAYSKDVPTGALPNAMISEVGGMTRKCTNLIGQRDEVCSMNGITFTRNLDGSITANGTATNQAYNTMVRHIMPNGTYTISLSGGTSTPFLYIAFTDGTAETVRTGKQMSFTLTDDKKISYVILNVNSGGTLTNETYYIMLNKGDAALPYEPYFEGLRDAKVTAVESVGVNLIPFPYTDSSKERNGVSFTVNADRSITISGTATDTAVFTLSNNIYLGDEDMSTLWVSSATNGKYYLNVKHVYYHALSLNLSIRITTGAIVNETIYPMASIDRILDYVPYFKNTFPIPEAVQALDGYGQGVNAQYYNKLVLDSASGVKKFVKNTRKRVLTGTEAWYFYKENDYGAYVYQTSIGDKRPSLEVKSSHFDYRGVAWDTADNGFVSGHSTNSSVYFNTSFATLDEWKAYLAEQYANETPVMVEYVLATPVETDLSDYFGDDNLIGVEGGGTVTMLNEYEYDVPSVIEYTVKGSDA